MNSVVTCTSCGTGAASCTSATVAATCNTGYYLSAKGVCEKCGLDHTTTCAL